MKEGINYIQALLRKQSSLNVASGHLKMSRYKTSFEKGISYYFMVSYLAQYTGQKMCASCPVSNIFDGLKQVLKGQLVASIRPTTTHKWFFQEAIFGFDDAQAESQFSKYMGIILFADYYLMLVNRPEYNPSHRCWLKKALKALSANFYGKI